VVERVPSTLLDAVRADVRPVRPLPAPWRRTLALAPLGAALAFAAPLFWGFRENLDSLGPGLEWGLTGLQVMVGLWIVGASLREAVPGRTLSRAALLAAASAAVLVEIGVTFMTSVEVPTVVPPGVWPRFAWECFGMAATSGAPILIACGFLAARALPERPALTGALYGLGAGLVADSGVRLFCWITEPTHVLVAHGGAVLALAATGAAAAVLVDRARVANRPEAPVPGSEPETEPMEDTVVLAIEDSLDLHAFAPRDIPSVVEAYLEAAQEAGLREVRVIHGRGKGVQKERVRQVLSRNERVEGFEEAPPDRGGFGATVVTLKSREREDREGKGSTREGT
jgi:Smr domain/Negative regulator of sigma F